MTITQEAAEKIHQQLLQANQLKNQGDFKGAEKICRDALETCPGYPDAHHMLGLINLDQKKYPRAIENFELAVKDYPEQPFVWVRLCQCWLELKNVAKATDAIETAKKYAADVGEVHYWLGQTQMAEGAIDDARASYQAAIKFDPKLAQAYRPLAKIETPEELPGLMAKIEAAMAALGEDLPPLARSNMIFARGRCHDRLGNPALGFDYYVAGKRIQQNPFPDWEASYREVLENGKKVFTNERLKSQVPDSERKFTPIFIVGIPRSGTTLVEQILASHGQVHGADEVPFIQDVARKLDEMTQGTPYPESLEKISPEQLKTLSAVYQENMQALAPKAVFITDKMLSNLHVLGFIHLLFPWAKVINVSRNPDDTCLSIMRNQFRVSAAPYLATLEDIGAYYRLYQDMMDFWKTFMGDSILDVAYEDVVENLEDEVKRILKFCGLKFEKACLDFHTTERPVHTLSTTQVKKPLYATSIGASKALARKLTPFQAALTGKRIEEPPREVKERIHQAATYFGEGNLERAEKIAGAVLETLPDQPDALQILGHIKNHAQKNDEAIGLFTKSLQAFPNQPSVWMALGDALNLVRRTAEAEHAFKMALIYDPGNTDAWLWLGAGALGRNDVQTAIRCLQKALQIDPLKGAPYALLAKIKQFEPDDAFMAALQTAAGEKARSPDDRAHALYGLANFSKRANDKEAFVTHVTEANSIQNQMAPMFDVAGEDLVKRTRAEITKASLKQAAKPGFMSTTPIFIVGLPRSGSSLTEQILSRHKDVFAGDELLFMYSHIITGIENKTGVAYPEGIGAFKARDWEAIGKAYHERVSSLSGGAKFATDKMLTNICYTGLIRLALPNAKVIHVRRNLMDTALSIYSNYFTERLYYCCNLKRLGGYARRVHDFAALWKALDPGFMLEVNYEDLVETQEAETRRILEYCGLEWDPACLEFHKSDRQVFTHSITQVFEPMYASSIGKWKDYADLLAPFRDSVKDLIDEEGFLKS